MRMAYSPALIGTQKTSIRIRICLHSIAHAHIGLPAETFGNISNDFSGPKSPKLSCTFYGLRHQNVYGDQPSLTNAPETCVPPATTQKITCKKKKDVFVSSNQLKYTKPFSTVLSLQGNYVQAKMARVEAENSCP